MPDQKQHAKITPEVSDLWTAIWVRSGSNLAAAKQIFADALRDARLDECLKTRNVIQAEMKGKTQQKDDSFPDAAGGPRVYMKKGEWLATGFELQFYTDQIRRIEERIAALERGEA